MPDRDPETGRLLQYRGSKTSPDCRHCPCAVQGKPTKSVPAFGATGGLAVVGEGPGTEELYQSYPFVGPSGRVLSQCLTRGGIDRQLLWITNATQCKRPSDDKDLRRAVDCCRPRLEEELRNVKPTAILALGGTASKALKLPVYSIMEARGTVQESPLLPGVPVVVSIHPAALLRGGAGEIGGGGKQKQNVDAQAMFLQADIEKANRISTGELAPKWSDDIKVVTDKNEAQVEMDAILRDARAWGFLGVDLEWDRDRNITWVGFGCEARAVAFEWSVLEGEPLELAKVAMADETLPKIIHNLQADKAIWELVGPVRGILEDSMLLHHAAFPGIAHDLQQVASQFLVVPPWKTARREERKAFLAREKARIKDEQKAARVKAAEARNAASKAARVGRQAVKKEANQLCHKTTNDARARGVPLAEAKVEGQKAALAFVASRGYKGHYTLTAKGSASLKVEDGDVSSVPAATTA